MKRTTKATCATCGSDEVYQDAWVSMNNPGEMLVPYDDTHCEQCGGECSVVETAYVEVPVELIMDALEYAESATLEGDELPPFVAQLRALIEE